MQTSDGLIRPFAIVFMGMFAAAQSAHAAEPRFVQDRIGIGFWVDPPIDDKADEHYKEIADASFTFVIGGFGATHRKDVERQLELCQKYGLKAVVSSKLEEPADALPNGD